jgi:hypothetical protein
MTNILLPVSLLAVVLLGTSAGVHVGGLAALNPALRALDARTSIAVKQSTDRHFPSFTRPLTLAGLVALLAQTLLGGLYGRVGVAVLAGLGLVAALVALVAVLRGDLPINRQMAGWSPGDPPADWRTWRARWERDFLVRTISTAVAFLAAVAALAVLR